MRASTLRSSVFAGCALGGSLFVLSCSGSDKDDKGTGGAASGAGGAGNASGAGASGGSAATSGSAGSGTGGSSGSGGGGNGGASGGSSGTSGGGSSSGGSAGQGGASTTGGSSGAGGSDASGGEAGAGASGGSAGTSGGSAGASGGSAGSGGLTGAMPSPGCGMDPPASGPEHQTIDVKGTEREYILRVPEGYDKTKPYRLIMAYHGMSGSATQVDNGDPPNTGLDATGPYYGIKTEANEQAIFVAGQALSGGWTNSQDRDLDYVKALLTRLEGELCIDQSRVFATGFSFGAIMTITIGCNMPEMFRAIAPMSGSLNNGCPEQPAPAIAYWASHGDMDTTIKPAQGEAARDEFVKRNGCDATSKPTDRDGCVSYDGCDAGKPVTWCVFSGIHEPPPYSGPAVWQFLSAF